MESTMLQALDFLRDHKEIALATCEGNLDFVECRHDSGIPKQALMPLAVPALPKMRIFSDYEAGVECTLLCNLTRKGHLS